MVDGVTIVSVSQSFLAYRWVHYSSFFIPEKCFELVENRLYAYADVSTLLAIVRKPVDRPAVAASLNRYLVWIQQWCNEWCMILNPNKTKA